MNRLAFAVGLGVGLAVGVGAFGAVSRALADDGLPPAPPSMDPEDALNPVSIVTGPGVKIGEGTVFRPQLGIETGVVSNVFYQNQAPIAAGMLRIEAQVGTGSLPNQRLGARTLEDQDNGPNQANTAVTIGDFQYSADLFATYDQYLSGNSDVSAQGGLGGGLLLRGIVDPQGPLQFAFQNFFNRVIRATNFESNTDTDRDVNTLALRLNYAPPGRSLGGYLYYLNTIDVFEASSQQFANRLQNTAGFRVNWQWLPLTRLFVDLSEGYYTGIGQSQKVNSYPFTGIVGIQTALTLNLTVNAYIGYTNGFYASGPSYSALTGAALLGYRYSPLGRVTLLYQYLHNDSINANFYREHFLQLSFEQYFAPFVLVLTPELHFRQYDGTIVMDTNGSTVRDDTIAVATVGARYLFRDWIAATLDYQVADVSTNFRYDAGNGVVIDPSYIRQQLLLGVRMAY